MTTKYQVWIRDAHLAGHIIVEDDGSMEEIMDTARKYACDVWDKDVVSSDVSVCQISPEYYQDIARSTAKDSIAVGM